MLRGEVKGLKRNQEQIEDAQKKAEELTKTMNGLSDEGFSQRYYNDPYFHKGVDVIAELYLIAMKAK